MRSPIAVASSLLLALGAGSSAAAERYAPGQETNLLEIRSVAVDGRPVSWRAGRELRLRPSPESVAFGFGPVTNASRAPVRLRYKLEGYDEAWHEGGGDMNLTIRFYDDSGDRIDQKIFRVSGNSVGWNGALDGSVLTHRHETLVVPPRASRLWVVISSAGPPAAVGIYVVDDLVVSTLSSTHAPVGVLLRPPFGLPSTNAAANFVPPGWVRDGTHPSMARIVELGPDRLTKAFAILDEDAAGHAEWHTLKESAPRVTPGDQLAVEWNEMFSMGVGDVREAVYHNLPAGDFRFRVAETTALGVPTGAEASLAVWVPLPLWERPWFWATVVTSLIVSLVAGSRYFAWQRMRQTMLRLNHQRMLEQDRLRIAQNIHDDLGTRVTQISLLSAMAQGNPAFPEKARADFDNISHMCRDLVSALYETVWAVNPENDNLDALGNYVCQMVDNLCDKAQLPHRLHVAELPRDVQVSSTVRHHLIMAVKEAVHNVIKHAQASELSVSVDWERTTLTIRVQDNGRGLDPAARGVGNGLANMQRRLEHAGGTCSFHSESGRGTTVLFRANIQSPG